MENMPVLIQLGWTFLVFQAYSFGARRKSSTLAASVHVVLLQSEVGTTNSRSPHSTCLSACPLGAPLLESASTASLFCSILTITVQTLAAPQF